MCAGSVVGKGEGVGEGNGELTCGRRELATQRPPPHPINPPPFIKDKTGENASATLACSIRRGVHGTGLGMLCGSRLAAATSPPTILPFVYPD